jgi:hypothetical protein
MRKPRGEITKLSSLFEKYKKILKAPQGSVVDAFCELIYELLELRLDKKMVTYNVHTRVLYINVKGPVKTEITLRKKEILTHLSARLGIQNAPREIL